MTDLHGNEPVVFDYDAAGQLVSAARAAATAIGDERGARSRAVADAQQQFQGYYAQLFAANAQTAAGDGDRLVVALDGLATIAQNLIAAAHSEDSRRATARAWYEHHEHRSALEQIGDALFGEDSPPEGPKPPPTPAPPAIPQPQPRHIGGQGSSGGTSSAIPEHLASFASTSAAANSRIDPHQSRVASLVNTFNANTKWGQIEAGPLLAAFLAWNKANENDVAWARTLAAAFRAAGGDGSLVTLSNSGLGAALKAAGVNASRQDLAISMPETKGFSVTTGYSLDPVNTATGNFIESETDLAFGGAAALALTRMYNSFTVEEGAFGHGWSSLAEAGLAIDDEKASLTLADGRVVVFPRLGDTWGQPVSDARWLTTLEDGSHRVTGNDGSWWAFAHSGRMTAYGNGPGTTVTLSHDDHGRLVGISHERGRAITLTWAGERISAATTSDGRTASYTYDGEGHLLSVSAPGADRTYRWDAEAHLVTAVIDADGVVEAENTYDEQRRVVTQLTPHGRHVRFSYLPGRVTVIDDPDGSNANTWIADPWGRLVGVIDSDDNRQSMSYDAHGNLVVVTERDGSTTIHEYDDRSRRTRTVLPTGADLRYAYDDADRVATVVAGAPENPDAVTTYTYEGDERNPATITDPEGGVTRLAWARGLLSSVIGPTGVRVTFEHDEHGNLRGTTDADGNTARLDYDGAGRVVAAITPLGHRTTYVYDDAGQLSHRTDPDGAVWTYEHTAAGRLSAVIDPLGGRTSIEHGQNGEATRTTDPLGRTLLRSFDDFGNVVGVTLPDGSSWKFVHDSLSRVVSATTPDGGTWLREYDVSGGLSQVSGPDGIAVSGSVDRGTGAVEVDEGDLTSKLLLDPLGRPIRTEQADGGETIYVYDRCGRVVEAIDAEGGLTQVQRDAAGRAVAVRSPLGAVTRYEYDGRGQLSATVAPLGEVTRYEYDADRRVVRTVLPGGDVALHEYDVCGRPVATYHPGVGTARYRYDLAGRVVETKDWLNGTRRFGYDSAGQLVEATDGNGHTTRFEYDVNGRNVAVIDPRGGTIVREFDAMGRCVAETDQVGRTTRAGYDAAGHQLWQEGPDGRRVSWTYDAAGRVTTVSIDGVLQSETRHDVRARTQTVTDHTDPSKPRTHVLTWNRRNQLTARSRDGRSVTWEYDADLRRTAMTTPDGNRTQYSYDASGRLVSMGHPIMGRVDLTRDPAGHVLMATAGDRIESWDYTDGFVTGHTSTSQEGSSRTEIERDADGRIAAILEDGRRTTFEYDGAYQLTLARSGERVSSWRYDECGRLVAETDAGSTIDYDYDAAGQLLALVRSEGGERRESRFTYDAVGRRTSVRTADVAITFDWSRVGWLSAITRSDSSGSVRTSLQVDALSELATVEGEEVFLDTASAVPGLVALGATPIVPAGPLTGVGGSWTAPGWRTARSTTPGDPWETRAAGTEVAPGILIGAGGELSIQGFEWMNARVYDPSARGFLTADPLDPVTGAGWAGNPYSYAGNDPLHALDPLGLRPATDADLRQWADAHQGWVANNWEYIAAAGMVIAGGVLIATGVGGPLGASLISSGIDVAIQKATTGHVDWGSVAVGAVTGLIPGVGLGAKTLLLQTLAKGATSGAASGAIEGVYGFATSPGPHTIGGFFLATGEGAAFGSVAGGAGAGAGHVIPDKLFNSRTFNPEADTVTLGRVMKTRVEPYALDHNYGYYEGTPEGLHNSLNRFPTVQHKVDMFYNKRWIQTQMQQGKHIVDIGAPVGPHPESGTPIGPSDFYDMEHQQVSHVYGRHAAGGKYSTDHQPAWDLS